MNGPALDSQAALEVFIFQLEDLANALPYVWRDPCLYLNLAWEPQGWTKGPPEECYLGGPEIRPPKEPEPRRKIETDADGKPPLPPKPEPTPKPPGHDRGTFETVTGDEARRRLSTRAKRLRDELLPELPPELTDELRETLTETLGLLREPGRGRDHEERVDKFVDKLFNLLGHLEHYAPPVEADCATSPIERRYKPPKCESCGGTTRVTSTRGRVRHLRCNNPNCLATFKSTR